MKNISFTFESIREAEFNNKLSKANKKLIKVLQPSLKVTNRVTFEKNLKDEYGLSHKVRMVTITLDAPDITRRENVEYIGTISLKTGIKTTYSEDDSVVLGAINDERLVCDHCNINRYRNIHHVFREDGEIKIIGSSCSKDYFGHDINKLLKIVEWMYIDEFEASLDYGSYGSRFYGQSIDDVIVATMYVTENGSKSWTGQNYASDSQIPTSHQVNSYVNPMPGFKESPEHVAYRDFYEDSIDAIGPWKDSIIELYKNKPCETDFDYNIFNQLFNQHGELREAITKVGIVAYAVWNVFNKLNVVEPTKPVEPKKESHYQGSIGDKVTITITMKVVISIKSAYGSCDLLIMEDIEGNIYSWFSSGSFHPQKDSTYTLKGSIKDHKDYKGVEQTVLTRCREVA